MDALVAVNANDNAKWTSCILWLKRDFLCCIWYLCFFSSFLTAQIQTWPLEEIVWMIWNMPEQVLCEFDLIVFFLFLKDGEQRSSIIDRDTRGQKKSKRAGLQYNCRHIFQWNIHWLIDWSFFDKWPMCHRLSMHWVIKLYFPKHERISLWFSWLSFWLLGTSLQLVYCFTVLDYIFQ